MGEGQIIKKNYNGIDAAKFVCSLLVIAIHISPLGADKNQLLTYLNYGIQKYIARIAVPFFFISSGYFLFKKTSIQEYEINHAKKYIIKILRLYLLWTLIYMPISIYAIVKDNEGILHGIWEYSRNVLFVGSYPHLWYLRALIVATIIISLFLYRRKNPNKILVIAFVLYLIGVFGNAWSVVLLPLKQSIPTIWRLLKTIGKVMVTTRNGLLFGFFFMSLGMSFSYYGNRIKKETALTGFILSMILLGGEVLFLKYNYKHIYEYDMYIFLAPSAYFLFSFCEQAEMKDSKIYKTLRIMGSLVYFIHLWVAFALINGYKIFKMDLDNTVFYFISVTLITLIISYLIYRLSMKEKYKMLQKLYS